MTRTASSALKWSEGRNREPCDFGIDKDWNPDTLLPMKVASKAMLRPTAFLGLGLNL